MAGNEIEELPGQRRGSRVFFYGTEAYHMDMRYKKDAYKYFRCASRMDTQCNALLFLSEVGVVEQRGEHNHAIDPHYKDDLKFRHEIRRIAQDILKEPDEVFREACRRYPESGTRASVLAMKSFIKRVRKEILPEAPKVIAKLGHKLRLYARTKQI